MATEKRRRHADHGMKTRLQICGIQAYLRYNFHTATGHGDDIESLGAPRDEGDPQDEFEYWRIRHPKRTDVFATVRIYSHDLMRPRGLHICYDADDMADLSTFEAIVQIVLWAQACGVAVTWYDRDLREIDPPDLRRDEYRARAEQAEAELAEAREGQRLAQEQLNRLTKPKRPYTRRPRGIEPQVGSDEDDGHLSQENGEGAGR